MSGTPGSKQAPYLKFKSQQKDSNPQPLSCKRTKLVKWLTVPLQTKWLWVRILLLMSLITHVIKMNLKKII